MKDNTLSKGEKKSTSNRLLIVEDNEDQITYLRHLFRRHGVDQARIDHASDIESAKKLLNSNAYHLIMLDLMLTAAGDGIELLRWLRASCTINHSAQVIISSICDDADARRNARELGCVGYLEKPFDEDDLVEVVGHILRERDRL